jgi:hypothetical protein
MENQVVEIAKSLIIKSGEVCELAEGYGSIPLHDKGMQEELEHINDFFQTSYGESLILAALINRKLVEDCGIDFGFCIKWLKLNTYMIPQLKSIFNSLYSKGYIKRNSSEWEDNEKYYFLTESTYYAIIYGNKEELRKNQIKNFYDVLGRIKTFYKDLLSDSLTVNDFSREVSRLVNDYRDYPEIIWIKEQHLEDKDEELLLICMVLAHFHPEGSINVSSILKNIQESTFQYKVKQILKGEHSLILNKFIDFQPNEFKSCLEMKLSTGIPSQIGIDIQENVVDPKSLQYGIVTQPDELVEYPIFLNAKGENELRKINALVKNHFHCAVPNENIREKIKAITLIIEGPSGVGKTQSIINFAKQNEFAIYEVRASQMKDMWVGGTEKAYEGVFKEFYKVRDYHLKNGKGTIMVINELEGILTCRMGAGRSIDFMIDSATSIFLKELENFSGILMSSCNQSEGFIDAAAFRRFNFKIYMTEPDFETMVKIFSNRFPQVEKNVVKSLCRKYSYKGGHIQNICGKYELYKLCDGEIHNVVETLTTLSDEEFSLTEKRNVPIGF